MLRSETPTRFPPFLGSSLKSSVFFPLLALLFFLVEVVRHFWLSPLIWATRVGCVFGLTFQIARLLRQLLRHQDFRFEVARGSPFHIGVPIYHVHCHCVGLAIVSGNRFITLLVVR